MVGILKEANIFLKIKCFFMSFYSNQRKMIKQLLLILLQIIYIYYNIQIQIQKCNLLKKYIKICFNLIPRRSLWLYLTHRVNLIYTILAWSFCAHGPSAIIARGYCSILADRREHHRRGNEQQV